MIASFNSFNSDITSMHLLPCLEMRDVYALMRVNQHFYRICQQNDSWIPLFKNKWPLSFSFYQNKVNSPWKLRSKKYTLQQQLMKEGFIHTHSKDFKTTCFKVNNSND